MNPIIENNKTAIDKLCKENKVNQLYVFGSVLTDKFNEKSDIDFIVDIENEDPFEYTDNYFNLQFGFENLFKREIDLLSLKSLKNPYFIKNVERTRKLIYG
jgi:uncharacterized protein